MVDKGDIPGTPLLSPRMASAGVVYWANMGAYLPHHNPSVTY